MLTGIEFASLEASSLPKLGFSLDCLEASDSLLNTNHDSHLISHLLVTQHFRPLTPFTLLFEQHQLKRLSFTGRFL